jgi:hypothetical protein
MGGGAEKDGDFFGGFELAFVSLAIAKRQGMELEALLARQGGGGGRVDPAAQENDCAIAGHV